MNIFVQDSTQARRDSVNAATTAAPSTAMPMPMPEMRTPQNAGYLQAVYVEVVIIFGGYILLQYRRNAKLRQRQARFRHGR